MVKNCKHKISKKSFQKLCRDKLDYLRLQICRNELEEIIYDLGIKKDEKIEYVAMNSFTSPATVKRILKKFYDRALNLPQKAFDYIFETN